jgi:hypothetical protein
MKIKSMFSLITLTAIFCSCTVSTQLYTWGDYSNATYNFIKTRTDKDRDELITCYKEIIKNQSGERKTVPPGIYADYGYLLIQTGKSDEGKQMLSKEIELYPESKVFIEKIIKNIQ